MLEVFLTPDIPVYINLFSQEYLLFSLAINILYATGDEDKRDTIDLLVLTLKRLNEKGFSGSRAFQEATKIAKSIIEKSLIVSS